MKKKNLIEPYAKENNLLQLSLFYFGKKRPCPTETTATWKDAKGDEYSLVCSSRYGVPSSFEQDVYTACMRIWVKQGMDSRQIIVNYSDIARELNLKPKNWVMHIKKALIVLGQARYHFKKCFIVPDENGSTQMDAQFSLFDTTLLFNAEKGKTGRSKRNSESFITFPEEIQHNLEKRYYQLLDMFVYKSLPSGLPRRLYEYLAKRKYHGINGVFKISEEAICRWLPIDDPNTTKRRARIKRISGNLIDIGYLEYYEFDKKKKMCLFKYSSISEEKPRDDNPADTVKDFVITVEATPKPKAISESTELERLISILRIKRVPKATKNTLAKHLNESGVDYVERNILYANEKAKSSYSNYLGKCLENDYAEAWSEEKEQKQDTLFDLNEELKKKEELEQEEKMREQELEKLRSEFLERASKLGLVFTNMAMEAAEKETQDNPAKGFVIKHAYAERLLGIVNEIGGSFPKEVLSMDVNKKLWSDKGK